MRSDGIETTEMAANRAYLDHNASAPLLAASRAAMVDALEIAANPSSVHAEGRAARAMVERARRDVAALVNAKAENVVFTSGATEAATTLLTPDWQMGRGAARMARLYVSETDHPCVLGGGRFPAAQLTRIGVDGSGILDLAALKELLAAHDRDDGLPLVAIHSANNETGVIQPVQEISAIVKAAGGVLVVDAVQAAGRLEIDIADGHADYLILSSHKIGGPKGAGAIVALSNLMMPRPLITGGGQEKGHRAGTENLAAIAGFGAAAVEAGRMLSEIGAVRARRDAIEHILRASDVVIHGAAAERLPNTTFFSIADIKAETAQIAFDLAGVALSAGSACSSGRVGPSHVLKAMGFGDQAGGVRVSIGHSTTEADVEMFKSALHGLIARRQGANRAA